MWNEILELELKNSTWKDAKRAYANLIKVYRPDTHPEEFKILRQAYEDAKGFYSERANTLSEEIEPVNYYQKNNRLVFQSESEDYILKASSGQGDQGVESYDTARKELQLKLDNWQHSYYSNQINYQELLTFIQNSHIDFNPGFSCIVANFLIENLRYSWLPFSKKYSINPRLVRELNQLFDWSSNMDELIETFGSNKVKLLYHCIESDKSFASILIEEKIMAFFEIIGNFRNKVETINFVGKPAGKLIDLLVLAAIILISISGYIGIQFLLNYLDIKHIFGSAIIIYCIYWLLKKFYLTVTNKK